MNQLYPIIRRHRRVLADSHQLPAVMVCPHCGRAADEPPAAKAETPKPENLRVDAGNRQPPTANIEQPVVATPAPENLVNEVLGGSSELSLMPSTTGETPVPTRKRRERADQN